MKWEKLKELIDKFRLADFKNRITSDQVGLINFKTENYTYNFNVDPEALSKLLDSQIGDKAEITIKKKALERLKSIDSTLDLLSDSTSVEVASAITLSTAIEFVTDPLTKKLPEDE